MVMDNSEWKMMQNEAVVTYPVS